MKNTHYTTLHFSTHTKNSSNDSTILPTINNNSRLSEHSSFLSNLNSNLLISPQKIQNVKKIHLKHPVNSFNIKFAEELNKEAYIIDKNRMLNVNEISEPNRKYEYFAYKHKRKLENKPMYRFRLQPLRADKVSKIDKFVERLYKLKTLEKSY